VADIAMLGMTFEKMENHWESYTKSIISNNRYFCEKLQEIGATCLLPSGYLPDNHQLFWYFKNQDNENLYKIFSQI